MYKFIVIVAAAMPTILFLRAILVGRSQKALRVQEADRLSGMGDLVRCRLCFPLFGCKPDPFNVEMTFVAHRP
jgi:hypothetical protein